MGHQTWVGRLLKSKSTDQDADQDSWIISAGFDQNAPILLQLASDGASDLGGWVVAIRCFNLGKLSRGQPPQRLAAVPLSLTCFVKAPSQMPASCGALRVAWLYF